MLSRRHLTLVGLFCLTLGDGLCQSNKVSWTNNGNAFGNSTNWKDSGGNATLPTSANVAAFDNTVTTQPDVSSAQTVDGLQITDTAGNVTLTGNATLTVGASGIDNASTANTQVIAAPLDFEGNSSVISNAGDLTISSNVVNNTTDGLELTGGGNNGAISGNIGGNGALKKSGTGTWKLSGANVYTGATEVLDGSLQVNASGAIPTGGNVTVDEQSAGGTATLDLADTTQTVGSLTLRGASNSSNVVDLGPTGTLVLNGDVHYDASNQPNGGRIWNGTAVELGSAQRTFTVDHSTNAANADLSVDTSITGTGGLTKEGNGTLVLSADNTYTGDTMVGNGTLQIGGGGTSGVVAGNIANNGHLVFDRSDNATYAGAISGSGDLVQNGNGSGKLTLAGANTFTGTTKVTNGTLAISADANLGAAPATSTPGDLTLDAGTLETTADVTLASNRGVSLGAGGGTFQTDATTKLNYGGTIAGAGALIKNGPGTLELGGTSSYTGNTTVGAGTLQDAHANAFSPSSRVFIAEGANVAVNNDESVAGLADSGTSGGNVAIASGATLTLTNGDIFSGSISGNGTLALTNSAGSYGQVLTGNNSYSGGTRIDPDTTLQLGLGAAGVGGTTGAIRSGNIVNNGTLLFTRADGIEYGGISGSGMVDQAGGGTLTLDTGNSYTGGTVIESGTVADAAAGALPNGGNVFMSGGNLNVGHDEAIGGLGDWTISGGGAGNVTIATGATLAVTQSGSTFSGDIHGGGALKISNGAYETLAGAASHTGGTSVDGGATLQIGAGGSTGAVGGAVMNNGTVIFNRADGISYGGITGHGQIEQDGTGTLTLAGTNSYEGDTLVANGTLTDANAGAFSPKSVIRLDGSAAALNVTANESIAGLAGSTTGGVNLTGTLTINGPGDSFDGPISGGGALRIARGTVQALGGAATHTGGTTVDSGGTLQVGDGAVNGSIAGNITNNGTVRFDREDAQTYAGSISGSGSLEVGWAGGNVTVTGQNSYTGDTQIDSGTLIVGAANALPTGTRVSIGYGRLDVEANQTIGQLAGSYSAGLNVGGGHTLTIAPGAANTNGQFDGEIDGTGGLALAGATGTRFTLDGSSTYSGGTHVQAGTLLVGSDTALGTGQVTVDPAAALLIGNSDSGDVSLANHVGLGSGATVGGGTNDYGLEFSGPVSVSTSAATVHLDDSVRFAGGLKAASGSTALTFDTTAGGHFGTAVLLGAVDPSVTAINASNAAVVFGAQAAVPASGLTLGATNGYVGIEAMADTSTYATPTAASVMNLIGNKSAFAGTIGFDTDSRAAVPHAFNDAINLSNFGAGTTLGSTTAAVLTGTITPGANGYAFGNGGGALFVQSALTSGNVTVSSNSSIPGNSLIAVFQGNNSFGGRLAVNNSVAVLDSAAALPAGDAVSLGANGYLGYTEAFTGAHTFTDFVAHQIAPGAYTATSVIGLDSHTYAANVLASGDGWGSRSVADRIDLSTLNPVYLGTTTQVVLNGTIIAPNRGGANKTLSLLAAKDGVLTIDSSLTSNNVSSVVVGSGAAFATGTVALDIGSTYTGGTTLKSGTLLLGTSSQRSGSTILAGPIGTGTLTVSPAGQNEPVLAAAGGVVLDNSVALGGTLQLGTPGSSVYYESATPSSSSPYSFANLVMDGVISDVSGKVGALDIAGSVQLDGANTFTGGVNLRSGELTLGNDQALGNGGTLTIASDDGFTYLNSSNGSRTLANPIVISGGDQSVYFSGDFTLNGSLALNVPLSVSVMPGTSLKLNGEITGAAPLTANSGVVLVTPSATNTSTGGLVANAGTIVLGSASALPASPAYNALTSDYAGYIGIGFVPGNLQSDFVDRFNKGATDGAIGFDSAGATNTFTAPIDLTGFNSSARLGSATSARLTGTITPQGADYNFGNGGGKLEVASALTDGADASGVVSRDVYVDSNSDAPLTLRLTGANTYTGGTSVYDSGVIFGTGALPATGSIHGSYGYAGTEDAALMASPALFLSRFATGVSHTIIGFDSANGTAVTVAGNISLAAFTDPNVFIGTATNAVVTGNIALPATESTYHFAGYKGGQLTIATQLTGANGVVIGDSNTPATFASPGLGGSALSRVTLTGANTYSGSTTLAAGELFVGNNTALGTGPLMIGSNAAEDGRHLGFSATTSGLTLANAVALGSADLDVGAGGASFALAGNITGDTSSALHKIDAGTLTLSGDNTNFGGSVIIQGGGVVFDAVASGSSAGSAILMFDSPSVAAATFRGNATINGIADDNGTGTINLTAGKSLTVNQTFDAAFNGTIAGSTAGLTLEGNGSELRMAGNNAYSGPTSIQGGVAVVAASSTAFGPATNAVTLNGGKLVLEQGITVSNPLTVTAGALGGAGTFASPTAVTVGDNAVLAPGMKDAIATLHFANSLTFAGGGTLRLRLLDTTAAAGGWDEVQVGGEVAVTATSAHPFNFQIAPFTAGGLLNGLPMNFNPSVAASWLVVSANAITGFDPTQNQFTIDSSALNGVLGGGSFSLGLNSTGDGLMLNFTPVPEPSTYALMIAGLGAVMFASRRRRRRRA